MLNIITIAAIILILINSTLQQQQSNNRITTTVSESTFIGTREYVSATNDRRTKQYYSFKGIPYAYPPTGERRFQETELYQIGSGTHVATEFGPSCPQYDENRKSVVGSENCLFLNVYTNNLPGGRETSSRPLLPVIFYIHGGYYETGSGSEIGAKRLLKQDIVLVTINYRLGILGFLSTGDEINPGNYGILDLIIGLKWVNNYIRDFGGNPGRVTVMGHNSGGALANILMMSPRAFEYFSGAVIISGNSFCDWSVSEGPGVYSQEVGGVIGCHGDESSFLMDCLLSKSSEEIVNAQVKLKKFINFPIRAAPIVDFGMRSDPVLPGEPRELIQAGAFAQVPVILGVNKNEGLNSYLKIHNEVGESFKDQDYFEGIMLPDLINNVLDNPEPIGVVVDAVKAQYFESLDVLNDTKIVISELVDLLGDKLVYSCHYEVLDYLSLASKSPVYSYVFDHKSVGGPSSVSMEINNVRGLGVHHSLFNHGVASGDDLFYLFEPVGGERGRLRGIEDERVSDLICRVVQGFALTGSPSSGLNLIPNSVPWRPIKPGNINFYNITAIPSPMGDNFRKGESLFWLRTIPYIQQLGDTIINLEDYPLYFWVMLGIGVFLFFVCVILSFVLWRYCRNSY